jgi:hypothetical protein
VERGPFSLYKAPSSVGALILVVVFASLRT